MNRISRQLLFIVALVLVFALVWSRVQIWIRVDLSLWQALLMFTIAVVALFLALDHLINRNR